jgi:hypothetical protein
MVSHLQVFRLKIWMHFSIPPHPIYLILRDAIILRKSKEQKTDRKLNNGLHNLPNITRLHLHMFLLYSIDVYIYILGLSIYQEKLVISDFNV